MDRRYKFSIEKKDGITYLVGRASFIYKGKEQEAVHTIPVDDGTREQDIDKDIQKKVMYELDRSINKYKLEH